MKRFALATILVPVLLVMGSQAAHAGNPHFVGSPEITRTDNSLTVSGKIAGLGNEEQIHVVLSALGECINPGGKKPKAANKESFSAEGDFPVQNGKATFELTLTATFQPSCSPPMSVVFSNVTITETTTGLTRSFGGTF